MKEFSLKDELEQQFNSLQSFWDIKGIIDSAKRIYTLGYDTKVISSIFELISTPLIEEIARRNNLEIIYSSSQTTYPDFTLRGEILQGSLIAIDVKSTYRRFYSGSPNYRCGFTLGSYTSFLRNNTKNIVFPYNQYKEHWIVGFIYTRSKEFTTGIRNIEEIDQIVPAIQDVEFLVQEKYKIASDQPGSGNTANIGSVTDPQTLKTGTGPFSSLGNQVFEDYWRNYKTRAMAQRTGQPQSYSNLKQYLEWKQSFSDKK